jgi:hypothetical protein
MSLKIRGWQWPNVKVLAARLSLVGVLVALASCGTSPSNSEPNGTVTLPPSYTGGAQYFPVGAFHVQGNKFVDSTGHTFLLHGAQIAGAFNAQNLDGKEQLAAQHLDSPTFDVMHQQWNMNALRIPTCDYLWQADPTGYLSHLDQVVHAANSAKLVVVLDLHEDARCGAPTQNLNFKLPLPEAATYWTAIAAHYKNNPDVIFDVYNEPVTKKPATDLTDTDWQLWLHGGTVQGVQVLGMQNLVDAIRGTGATQVVMVEGLHGGSSLTNIGNHLVADSNVSYEVHVYFSPTAVTADQWDANFGFLSNRFPVYVGEWALLPNAFYPNQCRSVPHDQADQKVTEFMTYMDAHTMSWTAWAFMESRLIQNYTNYAPTTLDIPWTCGDTNSPAGMGTLVRQHLLAYK